VEFVLREFRRQDFDTLWRIDQECFAPGIAYSRLELAAYIRLRGAFTVVAERLGNNGGPVNASGSEVLGFIVSQANQAQVKRAQANRAQAKRRGVGHILTIDVPPESRRFGVGSKLLATAEERLRTASCHSIVLETAVDNAAALAFYKRHHYSVVKTILRYYSNGLDAFVLEKELRSGSRDK
jgi:ribosomal-protein-alanine N-acetyltransferase